MKINGKSISKLRVTVMGLGLHGGGLASALFFARRGARVTVTDIREREELLSSIEKLAGYDIRYVLGRHNEDDFIHTDMVIKNPGVTADSPFVRAARTHNVPVESDISIFLSLCNNPLIAVTGSKGKSTTVSALFHCLRAHNPRTRLGGNITVSPLTFVEELGEDDPVILELSSWQLADLKGNKRFMPKIAIITNILPDHMNRYANMEEYVADKKIIYANQTRDDFSIFNFDDPYCLEFLRESKAGRLVFSANPLPDEMAGAWLEQGNGYARIENGARVHLLGKKLSVMGNHNRLNLLCAGLGLYLFGLAPNFIRKNLAGFPGIEHRLEKVREKQGVSFYNDSASTIPQAVVAAINSITAPLVLITGGTDKNIDFSPLRTIVRKPRTIILLQGTATQKIIAILEEAEVSYLGPFRDLKAAVDCAVEHALSGTAVVFSPGCASFGMFLNEFDRGKKYKTIVESL